MEIERKKAKKEENYKESKTVIEKKRIKQARMERREREKSGVYRQ